MKSGDMFNGINGVLIWKAPDYDEFDDGDEVTCVDVFIILDDPKKVMLQKSRWLQVLSRFGVRFINVKWVEESARVV